jgi:hypothetical protein
MLERPNHLFMMLGIGVERECAKSLEQRHGLLRVPTARNARAGNATSRFVVSLAVQFKFGKNPGEYSGLDGCECHIAQSFLCRLLRIGSGALTHSGVTLAPILGALVTAELVGGAAPSGLRAPFRPPRLLRSI